MKQKYIGSAFQLLLNSIIPFRTERVNQEVVSEVEDLIREELCS